MAAPEWLTADQASELSGHSPEVLQDLISDGGVEVRREDGTWYVERESLHDFEECLSLVQCWSD